MAHVLTTALSIVAPLHRFADLWAYALAQSKRRQRCNQMVPLGARPATLWKQLLASGVSILLSFQVVLAAPLQKKAQTKYGANVFMGLDFQRFEDACILFSAYMTAGQFFEGLEVTETASGRRFRKASQSASSYPERAVVRFRAVVWRCSAPPWEDPDPDLAKHIMISLRFEAQWKTGLELRPAEVLLMATSEGPHQIRDTLWADKSYEWIYDLSINSKDIPLTDHLILSAFSKDGKRLARLSARP